MVIDLRQPYRPSKRDLEAGLWIGKGYEVAQYQLHEAVFHGRSPVVVSRFTKRWRERGYLLVERWNRVGMNRLRLTARGRDVLRLHGAEPDELFVPSKPVAPKDLSHRLWINDLRVVLGSLPKKPELILPAWALERRFVPRLPAIPDVFAVTRNGSSSTVLAIEVDLGGEPLRSVFIPKLDVLQGVLGDFAKGNSASAILVLTSTERRRDAIAAATSELDVSIPIAVETLPKECGREGLRELAKMFNPGVESTAQPVEEKCLSLS